MPEITLTIDNQTITVPPGTTLLQAAQKIGAEIPTICYHAHFTAPSLCRLCVVEVEKSRVLASACSRECENGMVAQTDSPRVQQARRVILEMLNSAVDLSAAPELQTYIQKYGADVNAYSGGKRRGLPVISRIVTSQESDLNRALSAPVTILDDNPFYLRDYSKCILCWRCVQACGEDAQWTFAIYRGGRGFDARIATFFDAPIPQTTCVYCGNCVQACPTGALKSKREFWFEQGRDLRELARASRIDQRRKK